MATQTEQPAETYKLAEAEAEVSRLCREQILFALKVYPFLMPSMLHVALGTNTPSILWRAILNDLILEGEVCQIEERLTSPRGRQQSYTILHLASNKPNYLDTFDTLDN